MIHRLSLLAVLSALLVPCIPWAQASLVLVAGRQSPIVHVSADEARKLYLGIPLLVDGKRVNPLRNGIDPVATEMFMQRVMYMSSEAYDRQMRKRVREGWASCPPLKADRRALLEALASDPMAVTYMDRGQAIDNPPLRIVGEM